MNIIECKDFGELCDASRGVVHDASVVCVLQNAFTDTEAQMWPRDQRRLIRRENAGYGGDAVLHDIFEPPLIVNVGNPEEPDYREMHYRFSLLAQQLLMHSGIDPQGYRVDLAEFIARERVFVPHTDGSRAKCTPMMHVTSVGSGFARFFELPHTFAGSKIPHMADQQAGGFVIDTDTYHTVLEPNSASVCIGVGTIIVASFIGSREDYRPPIGHVIETTSPYRMSMSFRPIAA